MTPARTSAAWPSHEWGVVIMRSIEGGVTAPLGFRGRRAWRAASSAAARAPTAPLDLALLVADGPRRPPPCSRRTRPSPRPSIVSREHLAASGGRARRPLSSTAAARTPARELRASPSRARWRPRPHAPSAARPIRCSSRRPASSACRSTSRRSRRASRPRRAALDGAGGDAAMRAIMTTDPFPKSQRRRGRAADGTHHGRRHGQGLRHDRAAHGDDARLPDDRRARSSPPCSRARSVASSTRRSTRSRSTASARPTTASSRWRPARQASAITRDDDPRLLEPLRAVAGHLAREIVRGGEGATKLVTVQVTGAASACATRGWRRGRSRTRRS